MIQKIYSFCFFIIRFSGLAELIRFFFARNKVSIVMYHNPEHEMFEKHLKYLSRRYNLISFSDFMDAIKSQNFKNIPAYALIVTIDDGWKENYELLPMIKKYQFRPTIFLNSHIINTNRHFWWTTCKEEEIESLKIITNLAKFEALKEKYNFHSEKEFEGERQALNLSEIIAMKDFVDFGSHTCYHPILTRCSYEEKKREIIESKKALEKLLSCKVEMFSYPNGDYDEDCIEILKEGDYKAARTTDAGWNHKTSDLYKLKVTGVSDDASMNKLVAELTGLSMFFQYFFRGSFNGIKDKNI